MTLRKKILVITGLTFVCALAVVFAASHVIVLGSFARLEEQNVRTNVNRVTDALAEELEGIKSIAGDWAPWNDSRDFVLGENDAFVEENFTDGTIINLRLNSMVFFNSAGEVVYTKSVDLQEEMTVETSESLLEYIATNESLLQHSDTREGKSGIILLPENAVLLASWPISNSAYEKPIVGTLVVGRYVDEAEIEGLESRTHLSIEIARCDGGDLAEDYQVAMQELAGGDKVSIQLPDSSSIAGYTQLADIHGETALVVKVGMSRDIFNHGKTSSYYFMWALLTIGVILGTVLLISLDKVVLDPLSQLTGHVNTIAETDDLTTRLSMERSDEIGILAGEFDKMVAELYEARKKLLDESYQSGMAELASGVLHNVRNTLTPVTVEIESLCCEIRKAPLEQIEMARNELADGGAPPDRQQDLNEFLDVSGRSLASLVDNVRSRLKKVVGPVTQIEQMLAGQDELSRTAQPLEIFKLDELMRDTWALVSGELRAVAALEIDECICDLPQIKGNRISLVQVFSNLLINACESIQQVPARPGVIRISADVEYVDGVEMIGVEVCDNGAGIGSENIERIFERGFSTKKDGHAGLGLHWCANTLRAAGGQICAQSDEPGQGASLHVLFQREVS